MQLNSERSPRLFCVKTSTVKKRIRPRDSLASPEIFDSSCRRGLQTTAVGQQVTGGSQLAVDEDSEGRATRCLWFWAQATLGLVLGGCFWKAFVTHLHPE